MQNALKSVNKKMPSLVYQALREPGENFSGPRLQHGILIELMRADECS